MLKNIKKFIFIFIVLFILLSTTCFAATVSSEKAKLEIVENNICTINIHDIATFEKKIVDYNLEKKELTIGLKVTNNVEPIFAKPTEIFFVIDNSTSMNDAVTSTLNRLQVITNSAKTLATELLKNENVEIGIVRFSTGDNEGTISDASLITKPTNSKDTILNSITSIAEGELGPRTNIDAGLKVAVENFTAECESKYVILLTDGVPNTAVGGPTLTYSGETATKTKAEILSLKNNNISLISVMTGVPDVEEPSTGITYKELAQEIFGTTQEPTYGDFYYIPDNKIEQTICKTILNGFTVDPNSTLKNLKIYDYFPQEIVDNFDFSYVTKPTKGEVSASIDLQNNLIVWTIDSLAPGESFNLSYKLTLKDNIDSSILNTILKTNEKVDITADNITSVSSDVAPKIKVIAEAPTPIPQTGSTNLFVIIVSIIVIVAIVSVIRFYIIKRDI